MGSPLKIKEFHSIACIEREGTVGGPGHKSETCVREYAGDPPTPPPVLGVGGIKPTEETYVREDSREEEAVSHVVGGSLRS